MYFLESYILNLSSYFELWVCKYTKAEIFYLVVGHNKLRFQLNMIFFTQLGLRLVLRYYYDTQTKNYTILGSLLKKKVRKLTVFFQYPNAL